VNHLSDHGSFGSFALQNLTQIGSGVCDVDPKLKKMEIFVAFCSSSTNRDTALCAIMHVYRPCLSYEFYYFQSKGNKFVGGHFPQIFGSLVAKILIGSEKVRGCDNGNEIDRCDGDQTQQHHC